MYFLFIASEKRVLEACPGPGGVSAGTRVRVTGDEHRALPPRANVPANADAEPIGRPERRSRVAPARHPPLNITVTL